MQATTSHTVDVWRAGWIREMGVLRVTNTTLIEEDLHHVLTRIPHDVQELLKKTSGLIMGGGFIRSIIAGEQVNDIDLFGPTKALLEVTAKDFALKREARFYPTDNAFTVLTPGRIPVQFIHRWIYARPEDVLADFDFTIAQAVIFWIGMPEAGTWHSLISPHYYADLASHRLRYLAPARAEDAGGSILRMRKFLQRGYHIEAPSLAKVVARFAMGVRQVAESGMEESRLSTVMTGLLREVDPLTVVDGLELVDPSEQKAA